MKEKDIQKINNTYYKKVGRRYVPCKELIMEGFGEGLWMITENKSSRGTLNMLYPMLVHEFTNVGKFSDYYKAHKEKLTKAIMEDIGLLNLKVGFSANDLALCVISAISKIDE